MKFTSLFLSIALFCTECSAALVYSFGFDQANYSAASGSQFTVDLTFTETATAGEQLRFFTSAQGLTSFGPLDVNYTPTFPSPPVLSVANLGDVVFNSELSTTTFLVIDNPNSTLQIGGDGSGVKIGANAVSHQVVVASMTFTVLGTAGQQATFSLTPGLLGNAFYDGEFFPVDPVTYGSATFSVAGAAVPEPSSLLSLTLAGATCLVRLRKRAKGF